jgi:hypothetical protein
VVTSDIDDAIVRLAGRQRGNVRHEQLLRLGLTPAAIRARVRSGLLVPVHRGVYALGRPPHEPADRAAAAVLVCGELAALGFFGAAAHWSFHDYWPETFDVLAASRRRNRPGVVCHEIALAPRDIRWHNGIRLTSPARTALDCAPLTTDEKLKRLVNNARVNRHSRLTDEQLTDIVERNPRHPGRRALQWFIGDARSESPLEDILFPWCDAHGVPRPVTQAPLLGFRVDAFYEREKVVLELDGWDSHRGRESFERDRDRDATLLAAGFVVVRITQWRLEQDPAREAARLLQILDRRRRLLAA